MLIVDETGFLKKGTRSAGVQRQYSGTAGRTENCQIGTFLAYASTSGHALIDRELYLPASWTDDRDRCRAAGVPDEVGVATKPARPRRCSSVPSPPACRFRGSPAMKLTVKLPICGWLESRDVAYVLATKRNDALISTSGDKHRSDELIDGLSEHFWRRLSVGAGGHGPRTYDWARVPLGTSWPPGRGRWLLARRSISNPSEIAYYACYGPRRARLLDLAWTAGSRWHVEECSQQAKNEAGLDHYQARSWRAWYAHTTLSLLALAWLAAAKTQATQANSAPASRA